MLQWGVFVFVVNGRTTYVRRGCYNGVCLSVCYSCGWYGQQSRTSLVQYGASEPPRTPLRQNMATTVVTELTKVNNNNNNMVHSDPISPNNATTSPTSSSAPSILTIRMIMQGKVSPSLAHSPSQSRSLLAHSPSQPRIDYALTHSASHALTHPVSQPRIDYPFTQSVSQLFSQSVSRSVTH